MEAAYQESGDSVELIRVRLARPEAWSHNFVNTFRGMLEPGERLSLPGVAEQLVWLGGDATLQVGGVVEWTAGLYSRYDVQQVIAVLAAAAGEEEDEEFIIALAELQVVVAYAVARGASSKWRGRLVLNVSYTENVR